MPAAELLALPAHEIARRVREGAVTARAVVEAALARAETVQEATGAFVTLAREAALAAADAVDRAPDRGDLALAGVPFVAKDNLCTPGIATTAGSRILAGWVPPHAATTVARLQAAGAILIAKSDMDEFGMGSSSETSATGPVRNPWDRERVAGGSSGGSAVAVAAGAVPLALGTDTGGSVRQPAAFCGVLGFKPTYGTLSRYGVIAFGSSLDQVGVFARSAADVGLAMDAMTGRDPCDATTADVPADFAAAAAVADGDDLAGLRVGVVQELTGEGNDAAVRDAAGAAVAALRDAGAEVRDVRVPSARAGVATYYLIASAEASSNLARYDGSLTGERVGDEAEGQAEVTTSTRSAGFGPEVRRRILMGTFALSAGHVDAWYGRALAVRRKLANELDAAFEEVDVLLTPTAPGTAFRLGERRDDPLAMYLGDVDTCLANLAGIGAISVPAGRDAAGLPIGLQFMAPALADGRLLRVAAVLARSDGAAAEEGRFRAALAPL